MTAASMSNDLSISQRSCQFLVALDQCGLELQGPHMRTTAKRLIPSGEVDPGLLGRDALRYHAWDPETIRAHYDSLDAAASYELEVVFACERSQHRIIAITAGGTELAPAFALAPGGATTVRVAIPKAAIRAGTLDVALERRAGPDAVASELRLFGSAPVAPTITVVGDSRGGLIGTVSDAGYAGVAGAAVSVTLPDGGTLSVTTDDLGVFRVPLLDALPQGQHADLPITATSGGLVAKDKVSSRALARGLSELPIEASRLDLAGDWQFAPGRQPDPQAPEWTAASTTRVPGHVAFDGLFPDRGIATLRRPIAIPADWNGDAVFARFDGAYGRAEVFMNGRLAATHSAGATSFDVDLTSFLIAKENVLTVVLTEYTPHAVLDYMSWYAHISLLGIWREAFLFRVPGVHLGPTDLRADWDAQQHVGTLEVSTDIINLEAGARSYSLELSISDGGRLIHRTTLSGSVGAAGSARRQITLRVPDVEPWSAEIPRRYDLDISLSAAGHAAIYHRRVGFRHVEVRGNQLLVNGAPIRLLGVNRHDARMRTGRSMRDEDLRHDVLALRQANVNIIRTAHYPADPRLLDLCDELGMYVQDQMPICFAAGFDDHHWTRTNEAAHLVPFVLEVTAETVARDQVHPSVIIWDLANETQWGWGFDVQLALVRQMDPSRPTIFSFDLNQIGDVNLLPQMPPSKRPDIRTYHYPGWDRSWQEDVDWLRSYDQPVVLDECVPPFQDNARAPLHAEMLAIDPGVRDYWVTGVRPFMSRAMRDHGCIGGMIWSAVDDQWVLPIDESVGSGKWAHLTKLDYYRVRDVHPPQDGLTFRGEGEWGLLDGWGRSRPELWHVQKLYSPVEIVSAKFDATGDRLELSILNRHSHRSLATFEVRLVGAAMEGSVVLDAAPGCTGRAVLRVSAKATTVEIGFWHPEGWLVDGFSWNVPGRDVDPHAAVKAGAEPLRLVLEAKGDATLSGAETWLTSWPRFHVQYVNHPLEAVPLPVADRSRAAKMSDGAVMVPLVGVDWEGSLVARVTGGEAIFEYACQYLGEQVFDAREVGLAFDLPAALSDLWWHRAADWTAYPAGHIGRPRGYAPSAPGRADPLRPATSWEHDTTEAGTNDYRSTKRSVLAAGATDGQRSLSILSDGSQHVRTTIVNGKPLLHVLDWYGGVPLTMDTEHIWTAYFGTGQRIQHGTRFEGRVTIAYGKLPSAARGAGQRSDRPEELHA